MSGDKTTRTVVRILVPWGDAREERWLAEQERAGWHLENVRCFGYTFARAAPAETAYRLDVGPSVRRDRQEYFDLFGDAGWEHVGARGLWQYFRKPVVGGEVPEIYTDPGSRIAKYRRLACLMGAFTALIASQTGSRLASGAADRSAAAHGLDAILVLQTAVLAVLLYGIVRLLQLVSHLRGDQRRSA